jgi:hypothetical protein
MAHDSIEKATFAMASMLGVQSAAISQIPGDWKANPADSLSSLDSIATSSEPMHWSPPQKDHVGRGPIISTSAMN